MTGRVQVVSWDCSRVVNHVQWARKWEFALDLTRRTEKEQLGDLYYNFGLSGMLCEVARVASCRSSTNSSKNAHPLKLRYGEHFASYFVWQFAINYFYSNVNDCVKFLSLLHKDRQTSRSSGHRRRLLNVLIDTNKDIFTAEMNAKWYKMYRSEANLSKIWVSHKSFFAARIAHERRQRDHEIVSTRNSCRESSSVLIDWPIWKF